MTVQHSKFVSRIVISALTLLALANLAGQAHAQGSFAFEDVNLITMQDQTVQSGQTVVVVDGVIVDIAPVGQANVPPDAQVIPAAGAYLMPGLADMHVHLNNDPDSLVLNLANGITLIQNLNVDGGPAEIALGVASTTGALPGPRVLSGPAMLGLPPVTQFAFDRLNRAAAPFYDARAYVQGLTPWGVAYDQATARDYIARVEDAGADFIKTNLFIGREAFDTVIAESGMAVQGHVWMDVGVERYVDAGATIHHITEITPYLSNNALQGIPIQDWDLALVDDRLPALIERMATSGAALTPTVDLGGFVSLHLENFEVVANMPELAYLPAEVRAAIIDPNTNPLFQLVANTPENVALFQRFNEVQGRILRDMYAANVPLLAGTDCTSVPDLVCGFALHRELGFMVEYGLTPYQALVSATVAPARFLGEDDVAGTVAVGKRADLLLLGANPLADIANSRNIAGVMRAGTWYSRADLDALLDPIAQQYQ